LRGRSRTSGKDEVSPASKNRKDIGVANKLIASATAEAWREKKRRKGGSGALKKAELQKPDDLTERLNP